MSDIAIKVEGLSKRYQIGKRERYKTFRETIRGAMAAPFRRLGGKKADRIEETFWALKEINFDVKRGEVVGIIGRNGAGKSTLLKVLSRITEPTEGLIEVYGRVGSLLEVGTGFHPELTGRENVFLNGAILGMKRGEIARKFDEIVAFSEIEKFLDTPVKHYSSGMYTRLAFAVAAHLEPEILIVDEVLAVGDADFQKKCLGKMGEVAKEGRTVLFVSHNMLAVQKLCTRAILLRAGQIHASGPVGDIVANHLVPKSGDTYCSEPTGEGPQITGARFLTPTLRTDQPIEILVEWFLPEEVPGIKVGVGFNTPEGQRIFDSAPEDIGLDSPSDAGHHTATFRVPANSLVARNYMISIGLWKDSTLFDHAIPALTANVDAAPKGRYAHAPNSDGLVTIDCDWIGLQQA